MLILSRLSRLRQLDEEVLSVEERVKHGQKVFEEVAPPDIDDDSGQEEEEEECRDDSRNFNAADETSDSALGGILLRSQERLERLHADHCRRMDDLRVTAAQHTAAMTAVDTARSSVASGR